MLSKKVTEALNAQVEKEAYSSHLYIAMASWAEVKGYSGVADWLYAQSDEERLHMLKILRYINERGSEGRLGAVKEPPREYGSVKELFEAVLKHEQFISQSINEIVLLCGEEKDFTTQNFLQWFVNEQIEEEKNVRLILDKIKLVGDHNMYIFDRDIMSLRQPSPSPAQGNTP